MTQTDPPRRGRTRWLMIGPLTGLALIVIGAVALEAAGPRTDPESAAIEGLPPLALDDARSCLRLEDDLAAADIRERFTAGARVSSTQVYRCPSAFDGVAVTYVGEVVGDLLRRDGGAWVQVNDDPYALEVGPLIAHREQEGFNTGMSVWLPDGLHERLTGLGDSTRRGDVVLVTGQLLRDDPDDGGGITIRADELDLLAPSETVDAPLHLVQAVVAAVLALVAAGTFLWARREGKR